MCCDSKHGDYVSNTAIRNYGDTAADDEVMRCRCTGYVKDTPAADYTGCKCCHKVTGEDFLCNRCRAICKNCSVILPTVNTVTGVTAQK